MRSALALPALLLGLAALAALPGGGAQGASAPDVWVTLGPGTLVENDPSGILEVNDSSDARWIFDLDLAKPFTVIEFQGRDLAMERPRQLVPILQVPEDRYPLFHLYPNERVWEADSAAQVFHVTGDGDAPVLRVGIPGPGPQTLILEIDTVAPAFDLGEPRNVTPIGFYLETQTTELALADLEVRAAGASEWIRNPTPEYHVLQKFPIQGLDPDTEHEARVTFEDWAGNRAVSAPFTVRTAAAPQVAAVLVTPLTPLPNSTVDGENVVVRAMMESAAEIPRDGVRLFFDLAEVGGFEAHGADLQYTPPTLSPGLHRVNVEVTDAAGGFGRASWSFHVEGEETPLSGALVAVLGLVAAATVVATLRARRA